MDNETFYATAAQVLPTILIAIAVELYQLTREYTDLQPHYRDSTRDVPAGLFRSITNGPSRAYIFAIIFGATFVLGEVVSLTVLYFGVDGRLAWVAGAIAGLAVIALSGFAIYLQIARLRIIKLVTKVEQKRAEQRKQADPSSRA